MCLKFQFPSGRVDGFYFNMDDDVKDPPYRGGCYSVSNDVFHIDAAFEEAHDRHHKVAGANRKELEERDGKFRSLIHAAKTLNDVLEVIDLPAELQERLGKKSQTLVALNDETLSELKRAFTLDGASQTAENAERSAA